MADRALGLAQRVARARGALGDDLGEHGDGRLLHGRRADVQPARRVDPVQLFVGDADVTQPAVAVLANFGLVAGRKPTRKELEELAHALREVVPAMTIMLEPLADDAAATLVGAAERALPPHEVSAITERAGGNPLFATQLARSTLEVGDVGLPESAERVVGARIDLLPGELRTRRPDHGSFYPRVAGAANPCPNA